jgi:hypothetical protein
MDSDVFRARARPRFLSDRQFQASVGEWIAEILMGSKTIDDVAENACIDGAPLTIRQLRVLREMLAKF